MGSGSLAPASARVDVMQAVDGPGTGVFLPASIVNRAAKRSKSTKGRCSSGSGAGCAGRPRARHSQGGDTSGSSLKHHQQHQHPQENEEEKAAAVAAAAAAAASAALAEPPGRATSGVLRTLSAQSSSSSSTFAMAVDVRAPPAAEPAAEPVTADMSGPLVLDGAAPSLAALLCEAPSFHSMNGSSQQQLPETPCMHWAPQQMRYPPPPAPPPPVSASIASALSMRGLSDCLPSPSFDASGGNVHRLLQSAPLASLQDPPGLGLAGGGLVGSPLGSASGHLLRQQRSITLQTMQATGAYSAPLPGRLSALQQQVQLQLAELQEQDPSEQLLAALEEELCHLHTLHRQLLAAKAAAPLGSSAAAACSAAEVLHLDAVSQALAIKASVAAGVTSPIAVPPPPAPYFAPPAPAASSFVASGPLPSLQYALAPPSVASPPAEAFSSAAQLKLQQLLSVQQRQMELQQELMEMLPRA